MSEYDLHAVLFSLVLIGW